MRHKATGINFISRRDEGEKSRYYCAICSDFIIYIDINGNEINGFISEDRITKFQNEDG